METAPLIQGVPLLAPGQERVMNWGQYADLKSALGAEKIRITAKYESRGVLPWDPTEHVTESILESESFAGTVVHERAIVGIKDDLQEIRQGIDQIANGFKKLRVAIEVQGDSE